MNPHRSTIDRGGRLPWGGPYRLLGGALLLLGVVLGIGLRWTRLNAQIENDPSQPIVISADFSQEWTDGGFDIAIVRGRASVVQGTTTLSASQMVLRNEPGALTVYAEGQVRIDRPGETRSENRLVVRFPTAGEMTIGVKRRLTDTPAPEDALYKRAVTQIEAANRPGVQGAEQPPVGPELGPDLANAVPPAAGPSLVPPEAPVTNGTNLGTLGIQPPPGAFRRIRIFPRSFVVPFNVLSVESTNTTPPEQILVLSGGVNLLIDGLDAPSGLQELGIDQIGTVDLSADRVVIWTRGFDADAMQSETFQLRDVPFQVYLEGNIVLRQGDTTIRATRAVYDDRENRALLLNADLRTNVPAIDGQLRVRAERLRQLSTTSFHAQNASATTSKFGKPGYEIVSSDLFLDERPRAGFFGLPMTRDRFGRPLSPTVNYLTGYNNTFVFQGVPLVSAPVLSGPAEDPQIPVRRLRFGQDSILGFQAEATWNLAQLIGLTTPQGFDLDLQTDYFSDRGLGVGLANRYSGLNLFGLGDESTGEGLLRYQQDDGLDNLGLDRRNLIPESNNRGRIFGRHRSDLPDDITFMTGVGYVSDRNYLEQYYEQEFDTGLDQETFGYIKQDWDNWTGSAFVRGRVNDFATTTNWLPKLDLFGLSQQVGNSPLTWTSHSSVGFGQLRPGEAPTNPQEVFAPIPYVADVNGSVLMTRQEIDLPFTLGPGKLVPYLRGEAAHWDEGLNGTDVDRLVGTIGLRGSLPFWKLYPEVYSEIFNLNGLMHKSELYFDWNYTDSTARIGQIAQYNEFQDNAQERFLNRYLINTYGGVLPPEVDPRLYAIRHGIGEWVTVPYHELTDRLHVLRFGMRQRLQTKVGPLTRPRIRDWIVLDTGATFFPQDERDNFGESFGILNADLRWNISERTQFLGGAIYELFDRGQESWYVGMLSQRSTRGSIFVGLRSDQAGGALDSQILSASASYRASEKWIASAGTQYDLAQGEDRGQNLTVTRVGADFLVHIGARYDRSKNNVGFAVMIEPRFGDATPNTPRLDTLLGGGSFR